MSLATHALQGADLPYPTAPRSAAMDTYHGVQVADPYRPLEALDSIETRAWVRAQNALTRTWLDELPLRDQLHERLQQLVNYPRQGVPSFEAGKYLFSRNSGLQNQSVLYLADDPAAEGRVLIDPNELDAAGTISLGSTALSPDGKYLAYMLGERGSDWRTIHVLNVETGEKLSDEIKWVKFSALSWSGDSQGFVYTRYAAPDRSDNETFASLEERRSYYHRLGTPQEDDLLVYARPDEPELFTAVFFTEDSRYLMAIDRSSATNTNRYHAIPLGDPQKPDFSAEPLTLVDELVANFNFIGNDGDRFFFQTDYEAPRGRIIALTPGETAPATINTVIPERETPMESSALIGGHVLITWLQDAHSKVEVFALDGTSVGHVPLPGIGTVAGLSGKEDHTEVYYAFTSFLYPTSIFRYDLKTGANEAIFVPAIDFPIDDYTTEQVFYTSKDGTRVPMFLTYRKDLARDGKNPTLLYGYGGFNVALKPGFSTAWLSWIEQGGIYAMANLRGGGEYGREWHEAGIRDRKQNVFDDFIAAAEFLIAQDYTARDHLAIYGGSNGGLLVGAVLNQRPDLFAAGVPAVGVMDMLRFHKFTGGKYWTFDYGSSDDPDDFATLYAYSPLHNIRHATAYPAVMVTTGDHDDRVHPGHSFKYAAALQAAQAGPEPILIRVETDTGHGGGKPISKALEERADVWAFLLDRTRGDHAGDTTTQTPETDNTDSGA